MKTFRNIICLLLSLIFLLSFSMVAFAADEESTETVVEASELVSSFQNPNGRVLSVANLGNTRVYPENSLEGIMSCVSLGVDAVTVTVQLTKDDQLVLLSNKDLSINCATKAEGTAVMGQVSEYSLADLQSKFVLRAGHGNGTAATECGLVSLKEVITATSGNIIIIVTNGSSFVNEINALISELGANDTVIIGGFEPETLVESTAATMAGLPEGSSNSTVKTAIETSINAGAEVIKLDATKVKTLSSADGKIRLLIDMSSEDLCGGLPDRTAGWAKAIELGYSMIVTDYPSDLVYYLTRVETIRTSLSTLIGTAEGLDTSSYTKASRKALERALEDAKEVSSEGSLSLDEADEACYNLQEAIDGLTISTGDEKLMLPGWLVIIIVIAAIIVTVAVVVLVLRLVNKAKKSQRKLEKFKKKFNSDIPVINDETLTTNIAEDEESNMGIEEEPVTEEEPAPTEEAVVETEESSVVEIENSEEIVIPIEDSTDDSHIEIVDIIGDVEQENTDVSAEE